MGEHLDGLAAEYDCGQPPVAPQERPLAGSRCSVQILASQEDEQIA